MDVVMVKTISTAVQTEHQNRALEQSIISDWWKAGYTTFNHQEQLSYKDGRTGQEPNLQYFDQRSTTPPQPVNTKAVKCGLQAPQSV